MIVFEIIGEILGRIFVEVIFEGIIVGTFRLIKKGVEWIKVNIFGFQPKSIDPKKSLEKKLLYKKIELTENLNSVLKAGQNGAILEVINQDNVFAEFYDRKGNQIEWNDELVFKINMNQFKLKK
ncbi:hypothetical protein J0A67_04610 [Algoriphagus aestuariicola]|uniref:Uncharacterized protein n=1 Tax=Algoriphagus aestuariicola TaxID=1852016 RepID=A0ABS3BR19_9BACT|nr:hypothetical protein [Algoriphagus aestuariicola]MBN7800129.1 hypothetical protein [Algoriphagus aestuariicola]